MTQDDIGAEMKLTIFLIVLNLLPLGACKTVNSSSPSEAVENANALEGVLEFPIKARQRL